MTTDSPEIRARQILAPFGGMSDAQRDRLAAAIAAALEAERGRAEAALESETHWREQTAWARNERTKWRQMYAGLQMAFEQFAESRLEYRARALALVRQLRRVRECEHYEQERADSACWLWHRRERQARRFAKALLGWRDAQSLWPDSMKHAGELLARARRERDYWRNVVKESRDTAELLEGLRDKALAARDAATARAAAAERELEQARVLLEVARYDAIARGAAEARVREMEAAAGMVWHYIGKAMDALVASSAQRSDDLNLKLFAPAYLLIASKVLGRVLAAPAPDAQQPACLHLHRLAAGGYTECEDCGTILERPAGEGGEVE